MVFSVDHPHNESVFSPRFLIGFFGIPRPIRTVGSFGRVGCVSCLVIFGFLPIAHAAPSPLTYRHLHHLFTVPVYEMRAWVGEEEVWTFRGHAIMPPQELRAEGDTVPPLPTGYERTLRASWNRTAIEETLRRRIADHFDQEPGSVSIDRTASGAIVFEGVGFPGRAVDLAAASLLTVAALESGATDIILPVIETQPAVIVRDPALRAQGIRALVTVGESNFAGSTLNRVHNISVGLRRFNGHLIAPGETFSFVETLGRVDASTGYRKELTIIGERTVPDYGGGLCQVSSTAYRGVWEYGFPIIRRKNHSYAVSYYAPQGTDATVYPPYVDMQFSNDSPGALLIQTHMDPETHRAYFLYYGTRDNRTAHVAGPYTWNHKSPPPPRTEQTTQIAPGTQRKVGEAVPGMDVAWFRILRKDGKENIEGTYSVYQARPLFWQIGVASLTSGTGSLTDAPAGEEMLSD